jgi:hypothetical protein
MSGPSLGASPAFDALLRAAQQCETPLHGFDALIAGITADLQQRIARPVVVHVDTHDSPGAEVITVFGFVRYTKDPATGTIALSILDPDTGEWRVRTPGGSYGSPGGPVFFELDVLGDLKPQVEAWSCAVMRHWGDAIDAMFLDTEIYHRGHICEKLRRWIRDVLVRLVDWDQASADARAAMPLDADVQRWAHIGAPLCAGDYVACRRYNRAALWRDAFEQLERDAPQLVWLLSFMIDEEFLTTPQSDRAPLYVLRTALEKASKLTPVGWRHLLAGRRANFPHILDWIGPNRTSPRGPELTFWLEVVAQLRLSQPLCPEVAALFMHDEFRADPDAKAIWFRKVKLPVRVMHLILQEAQRCVDRGGLEHFTQIELINVLGWLDACQPTLDRNQLRAPWVWYVERARQWTENVYSSHTLSGFTWRSALGPMTIGPWTVWPLTNAWEVRMEAMRQRHCCDAYIDDCLSGRKRLFSVRDGEGRPAATLSIVADRLGRWFVDCYRSFANRPVGPALAGVENEVRKRYADASPPVPESPGC